MQSLLWLQKLPDILHTSYSDCTCLASALLRSEDKQLKQRGIHSAKDVFLAVCDRNGKLVIYESRDGKKHLVRQVK